MFFQSVSSIWYCYINSTYFYSCSIWNVRV